MASKDLKEESPVHFNPVAYRLRGDEVFPALLLTDPADRATVDLVFFHSKMAGGVVPKEKVKRGFDVGCWETFPNMTNHIKCEKALLASKADA